MTATTEAAMPDETYDWESARARMEKRADEGFPPAWQPEQPGEQIMGTVVRVAMQAPTSFGPAPVVELEEPNGGRYSVWLYHTVLRRSFERERVALGEVVLIRYLGKRRPEGGGNEYDNYELVVDRPLDRGEPDWEGMARRYGDVDTRPPEDAPPPPPDWSDAPDDDVPF